MIEILFPGGVKVDAKVGGHIVHTDQPAPVGEDTAPSPFDLFLTSMAACMGFYALRFCQERKIATGGLGLTLELLREPEKLIRVHLRLPADFPEKYREAIVRAVDHCSVKRHILEPPRFEIGVTSSQ